MLDDEANNLVDSNHRISCGLLILVATVTALMWVTPNTPSEKQ